MIQQRQRDIEYRETANDTRQRLMSDMSRLETKMERLSDQLNIKEREMQTMASKEQKVTTAFKTQLEKLQLEKDEFQRMLIATQQVRSQQNHELKKKEKEYVKLQERLNQVLMEKKKETKNGIEIMNLLQKEGRQRGTWNAKKADGDFYKMIVEAYESKKQELVAENADLRGLLRSMQADMRDFLNTSSGMGRSGSIANGSADLEPPPTPLGGRTDVFDLPFHMARDQIEQSLRAKMSTIKERMIQLQDQKGGQAGDSSARELQLEEQLAEARSIIDEQTTRMTRHNVPDSADNSDNFNEPQQSTEDSSFSSEETTGGQDTHRSNIEANRDLSRERTELAKAQQKLLEEQVSWASAVTSMAPNLRGHPGLLDSKVSYPRPFKILQIVDGLRILQASHIPSLPFPTRTSTSVLVHAYRQAQRYNHKISSRSSVAKQKSLGCKINDSSGQDLAAVLGLLKHEWITCIKQVESAMASICVHFCHLCFQYNFPFLQKQDEPEVGIACPESLINDKEHAENRTATIRPENKSPSILEIPIASQIFEVESPLRTELADLVPHVKCYENPWLDPLIWEKICAPIETLSNQEDYCVQLNNQKLKREALELEPSSMWSKFSFVTLHSSIST
ncbi:hypothetical protein M758_5G156000 [Ceratodon purpureus]|nr:hypothetical protein M758_5G156000 [Ceratodon purpureus]